MASEAADQAGMTLTAGNASAAPLLLRVPLQQHGGEGSKPALLYATFVSRDGSDRRRVVLHVTPEVSLEANPEPVEGDSNPVSTECCFRCARPRLLACAFLAAGLFVGSVDVSSALRFAGGDGRLRQGGAYGHNLGRDLFRRIGPSDQGQPLRLLHVRVRTNAAPFSICCFINIYRALLARHSHRPCGSLSLLCGRRGDFVTSTAVSASAECRRRYSMNAMTALNVGALAPKPFSTFHEQYMRRYLASGVQKVTLMSGGRVVPAQRRDGTIFDAHIKITELDPPAAGIGAATEGGAHAGRTFVAEIREANEGDEKQVDGRYWKVRR